MSILPQGSLTTEFNTESIKQPSRTYKIDFERGRIVGFCDGLEALKQAIYLILNTERYEHAIYSWNYGSELKSFIGIDKAILESEYKRLIKEALIQDDRIDNVDNFIFSYGKDSVTIKFTVFSNLGDLDIEKVVT
jgi:hypothetical protein